jgi:hypothetical protein
MFIIFTMVNVFGDEFSGLVRLWLDQNSPLNSLCSFSSKNLTGPDKGIYTSLQQAGINGQGSDPTMPEP